MINFNQKICKILETVARSYKFVDKPDSVIYTKVVLIPWTEYTPYMGSNVYHDNIGYVSKQTSETIKHIGTDYAVWQKEVFFDEAKDANSLQELLDVYDKMVRECLDVVFKEAVASGSIHNIDLQTKASIKDHQQRLIKLKELLTPYEGEVDLWRVLLDSTTDTLGACDIKIMGRVSTLKQVKSVVSDSNSEDDISNW